MTECCFPGLGSTQGARNTCKDAVYQAVTTQLTDQTAPPTLIEALPTTGKTTAAAKFAAELCEGDKDTKLTYLTHRTANRQQFERKVIEVATDDVAEDIIHLPVLDEDCPTARGEHGEAWQTRLRTLRDQGLSPSSLHRNEELKLPCGGRDCPYMSWWTADDTSSLLIGHLSHAYVPEVIEDRIIIVDEDPEDAYQQRFGPSELHELTKEFLSAHDDVPASDLDTLKLLRQEGDAFADSREQIYHEAIETDRFELGQQILDDGQGHVEAATLVEALLAPAVDSINDAKNKDTYRIELSNGVEHIRLADSTVVAYDPESGILVLRQPPEFNDAAAVVGLDGTPTPSLWKGRLGVEEIEHIQVLCDECRQTYLTEVLGYDLIQTTPYIKPYSGASAERIAFAKDRGLLHEVIRWADGAVGLITTKRVKEKLLSHDDGNEVDLSGEVINHYRNIKGSNEFAGDEVQTGVVVGSPHPGPNELRLLAGLNRDAFETEVVTETRDGHHYSRREPSPESEPYLHHVREHSVAQAILRFGREDGASVFVHSAAMPAWMKSVCHEHHVTLRSGGERAVIRALRELAEGTTSEIAEQAEVSDDTARKHLKELEDQGLVDRQGTDHRIIWVSVNEISEVSPTVNFDVPEQVLQ